MYSIDGVPLKNPGYGWRVKLRDTNPFQARSRTLPDFNTSGRDGTIQVRGYTPTPTVTLNITTPGQWLDALGELLALGKALTLTSNPNVTLKVEMVSRSTTPVSLAADLYLVSVVFRCPDVYWRDLLATMWGPSPLPGNGQTFTAFTGSNAPVRDALISVEGAVTGLAVLGANNTYFTYPPTIPDGTWLTLDSATGRGWTGLSAFAQTSEVTGQVGCGRGPYFLELVGSSLPTVSGLPLTVTYTAASGSPQIAVRGRNAYDR